MPEFSCTFPILYLLTQKKNIYRELCIPEQSTIPLHSHKPMLAVHKSRSGYITSKNKEQAIHFQFFPIYDIDCLL